MAEHDKWLIRMRLGEVRWEVAAEFKDGLIPLLKELGSPLEGHDKRIYRDDPGGPTIYTVKTNRPGLAGELFVKIYRRRGIWRLPAAGNLRSVPSREWKMAQAHSRLGLPIAAHLARGVKIKGGLVRDEYLVQESLTSYEPFEEYFHQTFRPELPGVRPEDKRKVIRDLAGLIRRMHDRGISRPDLRPKNVMAQSRSGGGVKLVFVDLDDSSLARPGRGFPIDDRVSELARFHGSFSPLFSQGYLIRFYRDYFEPDGLDRPAFQDLVKRSVELSDQRARAEEPKVISRVEKREYPYFWFETGDFRVYLRKPLYQNSLIELIDKLDRADDKSLARVKQVGGLPPRELVMIRGVDDGGLPHRAGSAARWAFWMSAVMERHGKSQFKVMAAVERKKGQGGYYLISRPQKSDYNLAEYLARRVAEEFSGLVWDRKFLIRVARFIEGLHVLGWAFPRPSGDDVWVRLTEQGTHELILFNLHKLRRIERDSGEALLGNLLDFWKVLPISQADGLMLAEEYLRFSRTLSSGRGAWMKRYMEWQMKPAGQPAE